MFAHGDPGAGEAVCPPHPMPPIVEVLEQQLHALHRYEAQRRTLVHECARGAVLHVAAHSFAMHVMRVFEKEAPNTPRHAPSCPVMPQHSRACHAWYAAARYATLRHAKPSHTDTASLTCHGEPG